MPMTQEEAAELAKRRQQALVEVMRLFDRHYPTTFASHPETNLYAGAWLAGTCLYRSFGYTEATAPGVVVLSEKANQGWPKLMNLFVFILGRESIKVDPAQLDFKIPPEHRSRLTILQVQEAMQDDFMAVMRKYGFDDAGAALTGVYVCTILYKVHCIRNQHLEPNQAAAIIAMGFQEGAKTSPLPLNL